jgi:hypothetical protein
MESIEALGEIMKGRAFENIKDARHSKYQILIISLKKEFLANRPPH